MNLGAFSLSLAVKDIHASRAFYEKLGFTAVLGEIEQNWQIMRNGATTIGLFQGMFDANSLTFNPGWDAQAQALSDFEDVRAIRQALVDAGLDVMGEIESENGPAHFMLMDPDGNPVLIDQHV